jgi:hypothetical protein
VLNQYWFNGDLILNGLILKIDFIFEVSRL